MIDSYFFTPAKSWTSAACWIGAVLCLSGGIGCQEPSSITQASFTPAAAARQSVWYVGVDLSRSVPAEQFAGYAGLARRAVLAFLNPADGLILQPFPSEEAPKTFLLEERLSQFKKTVLEIDQTLGQLEQPSGKRHHSDLGSLFERVNQRIQKDIEFGRAESFRYRLLLLTDGELDGAQGRSGTAVPDAIDYRILILGVGEVDEEPLETLARDNGFTRDERLFIVPHHLLGGLESDLERLVGLRPNPNLVTLFARQAKEEPQ